MDQKKASRLLTWAHMRIMSVFARSQSTKIFTTWIKPWLVSISSFSKSVFSLRTDWQLCWLHSESESKSGEQKKRVKLMGVGRRSLRRRSLQKKKDVTIFISSIGGGRIPFAGRIPGRRGLLGRRSRIFGEVGVWRRRRGLRPQQHVTEGRC